MEIMNVTPSDEERIWALLKPYFNNKLNPRRIPEWVATDQENKRCLCRHANSSMMIWACISQQARSGCDR